ncbi:MAG: hypothetical protein RL477_990 [Pseudomonadota bacterium]|jgi:hypothetical protein
MNGSFVSHRSRTAAASHRSRTAATGHRSRTAAAVSGAIFVTVAAALAPAPAWTQDRPVSLAPPAPLIAPAGTPAPAQPQAAPAGGIKVDKLGEIDANSVGLLDAGQGGFGINMWKGTPRSLVESLLPRIPAAPRSATARDLARRLLLSAAETPAGAAGKDAAGKDRTSLVALRVGRLLAQGDVVSAQALLRVVPHRNDDSDIALARAEVAFLMNDNAGACSEVREQLGRSDQPLWRKAQVFCQLLGGDTAGATIGAGLLQEQGVEDASFYGLARMLAGDKGVAVNGLERPDALHVAMMRAARVQVPPAAVSEGAPAVLRAVALSPNADLDTRLEAAEQAEMRGAFDADALRQLYLSVNFTPDELSGALSAAEKLSGPRARALLYRAARGQNVATAQAEIIARAFALARQQGRLPTAIRVMLPLLVAIEPTDSLAWFAADAGSAIYFAGGESTAAKWTALALARPEAAARTKDDAPKLPAGEALWPFAQLSTIAAPRAAGTPDGASSGSAGAPAAGQPAAAPVLDGAAFERWWLAAQVLGEETRARRATRILSLVEALGAGVPESAWEKLVTATATAPGALPAPGLMAGLRRAAQAGRIGETVLLALSALGAESLAKTDIRVLAPVVRALREAGLEEPARRLAVETVFDDQV